MTQEIKANINKIDYDLKSLFENVTIVEKTNRDKFYFEILADSLFFNICESKKWKRAAIKLNINKTSLAGKIINWSYLSNPLNENSEIVQRTSMIDTIANDIYRVVMESKMDRDYLINLPEQIESINENNSNIVEKKTLLENINDILDVYSCKMIDANTEETLTEQFSEREFVTTIVCNRITEQFAIGHRICALPEVSFVKFDNNTIIINHI